MRLPASIEIRDVGQIESTVLSSGQVMLTVQYEADRRRRYVRIFLDAECLSWQLLDPVAHVLQRRVESAVADLDRMRRQLAKVGEVKP